MKPKVFIGMFRGLSVVHIYLPGEFEHGRSICCEFKDVGPIIFSKGYEADDCEFFYMEQDELYIGEA